ncbi:tetratricopeptide repeat protein [Pedobacter metabolipauper]|uniref:Tetratricopeptide repeat protein n=1 Tax=Pedobacter metabolipauper TaxID=425513 RepID=A0A4R6SU80_9SPHI|nr:tetratricopeptide repeat protein [Pedobacter metabolipauper]TDQ08578.1 tetratricopeptide repeat protein [Pedobacter metabolipauper]
MKRLCFLFFILIGVQFSNAQSGIKLDNEKLLDYYQTQRYAEAALYLQSIFKEDTENPKEIAQLAYANIMANKLTEAQKNYLKLYAQQPKNLAILFNLATINIKRGNNEKAKGYYQEILTIDSTNYRVYKQLADISPNLVEKFSFLLKANKLNPIDGEIAFDLTQFYLDMKDYARAKSTLYPALNADTANLQLLKMKVPICLFMKEFDESIATGLRLLSYGDSSNFVVSNMAKSYYSKLDYTNALKYFLMVDVTTFDAEALSYNLGLTYRGLKDYKNSIPQFKAAIKAGISDGISRYYGLLGDSYERVDQNDEANAAYKKGLNFDNDGSLLYNIALVYESKLNDKKNAIVYYERYLNTIKPEIQPKLIGFLKEKIVELKK